MKRKLLSLIVSFSIVVALYLFNRERDSSLKVLPKVPTYTVKQKKDLPPTESPSTKRKTTPSTPIVKAPSTTSLKMQQKKIHSLVECLHRDNCGMKPEAGVPYYDESEVRGSKELKKILGHLVEQNITLKNLEYEKIFTLPNEQVKLSAATLYLRAHATPQGILKLLQYQESFTGSSRALLYTLLFNHSKDEETKIYLVKQLLQALNSQDSFMVLRILEESRNFHLKESDFKDVILTSCRIKDSPEDGHNWKMVRYALKESIQQNSYSLDIDSLCP